MFTKKSTAILYGIQKQAAQQMLDFDYLSERKASVAGFVSKGQKGRKIKLFYGSKEIFIPVYDSINDIKKEENIDTLINFASYRSAYQSTIEAMDSGRFKNIAIIAEGIPERQTREIIAKNKQSQNKINIIGPATVGAIVSGVFRIGNTGGSIENIIDSKLYRKGNVGLVTKSGGMSNEMRKVIADRTDGTHTSIAIGGDRYVGSSLLDIVWEYEKNPEIAMIVLLGEVGGTGEIDIAEYIKKQKITKPVVAWCIGTTGDLLKNNIQFGHAGAKANQKEESASYKNRYLKEAGAHVPESYQDFGELIQSVYEKFTDKKILTQRKNRKNMDTQYQNIKNRKASILSSSISDERGEELKYNGIKISKFVEQPSIGKVIGHLWLKKDLPEYASHFLETVLIVLADHGPCVSGATNTIIASRAGKDTVSSVIAGLCTIGPKFGGAIDEAGAYIFHAQKNNQSPEEFVETMKKQGKNIPGIGHKIKSIYNPDKRCEILKELSKKFPKNNALTYGLEIEKITLEKKANLILNVDGMIACMLLDILDDIFPEKEIQEQYIHSGLFNGLFILARTIGLIGHSIDQKMLSEELYRTPESLVHYL